MNKPFISQLWIYPIKSLKGIQLNEAKLERRGLEHDRRWMLVDIEGRFLSQRRLPRMALIEQELSEFGVCVRAPDMPPLIIPFFDSQVNLYDELQVYCWDDQIKAKHINTAIDNWFSEFLQTDCQLVYMPDDVERSVDADYALNNDIASFSDGFPYLLLSEASLEDLNTRLEEPLVINRFRPNIVVSGCEAYAEDTWEHFKLNQVDFFAVKPCSRCVITTVDPFTGEKQKNREPLNTLAKYRKMGRKVYFGQNLLHRFNRPYENQLKVGDSVEVVRQGSGLVFD